MKKDLLWKYLKDDKLKVGLYIFLILLNYLPSLISAYFWGKALECLIIKDLNGFGIYLTVWTSIYIIFYTVLQIPKEKIYNYLAIKFMKNVSKDLYKKIDNLPTIAFEDMGVGEFINRLYDDTERIMNLLAQLIRLICQSIVVVFVFILAFSISIYLGLEMVLFALVMGLISYNFFPKIKDTQKSIKKEADEYVKSATENITGIREIKALGIKNNVENRIFRRLDTLFHHNKDMKNYEIAYYSLNNLIYFILQFAILLTCGYFVVTGKVEYSVIIMLDMYLWRVDNVVESISDFGVNYNKVKVSLNRLDEIINNRLYQDECFGNMDLKNATGIVEFKDVSFKYREEEDYALKNLNLKLESNKKIAIVGRSGNGKSTIFNLLLRYFDATDGVITIDGINIKDLKEKALRSNISVIRQAPFLFNLSIKDNFKLVNEKASLSEIRKCCRMAYIDDYIMSLPNKYDTIIGEGGINLSGGQKQRIAIARTLMLNTKIILFDEATSALDNESQEYIKKTMDDLVKDHTIIIVAHRLSTIVDADQIHVIDSGTLVGTGTHEELLKQNKIYQKLYNNDIISSNQE